MLSYTSGTTGDPKGVKLTHKMMLNQAYATQNRIAMTLDPCTENDSYISYLPAVHSYEQSCQCLSLLYGVKIGFFSGDPLKLMADCALLKPTIFTSVPRVYNKIYAKLQAGLKEATGLGGYLFKNGVETKLENQRRGNGLTHSFYDKIVFGKIKGLLGGQVRIMSTGSAPIAAEVLDFLKVCFCCPLIEGYGMTESAGGACGTYADDGTAGHVGGPMQCTKFCLRDIPEMEYYTTGDVPKGELCMYGSNIMPGYFRNPEKTQEAIKNGWLHSGDVAKIDQNGKITIIDRVKNIFKLSQGEYIAPEKLENIYVQSSYVLQCWIYGDSLRDYVIGFFVIDPDQLKKQYDEIDDALMENEQLRKAVYESLM